jgi:glycosyltransferase involved in cell wall biosynthesis
MLPEVITNGVDGILASTPAEMAAHCRRLLADPAEARRLGAAARQTVLTRFSLGRFVAQWDGLLREAAELFYRGTR